MLTRLLSALRSRALPCAGSLRHPSRTDRDVLWRAKRNAFVRALAAHRLTEAEARRILAPLARDRRGAELETLASASNLPAAVLDRAIPLMGLQNFIRVEKKRRVASKAVLWVTATEHGVRYAGESGLSFVHGPANATTEARIESHAPGTTEGGRDA